MIAQKPAARPMILKRHASQRIRTAVQILFFTLVAAVTSTQALQDAGILQTIFRKTSLHAICPFGGVVSVYSLITSGSLVQKIHESSFVLLALVLLMSVLFGPVFCGWVCPLGSLQEWIGKLGRKIFGKRYNQMIPAKLDRYLRYVRYLVLGWVLYITASTATLLFQNVDPFFALFRFYTGEVSITAFAILGATMLLSLLIERPWCKYVCPYGALLGIFNLFRIFGIRRKASSCTNCGACDRACPMNISVSKTPAVHNHQCITCMKCTSESACPVADTVCLGTAKEN